MDTIEPKQKKPIHPLLVDALNRLESAVIQYRKTGIGYQHLSDAMDDVSSFDQGRDGLLE